MYWARHLGRPSVCCSSSPIKPSAIAASSRVVTLPSVGWGSDLVTRSPRSRRTFVGVGFGPRLSMGLTLVPTRTIFVKPQAVQPVLGRRRSKAGPEILSPLPPLPVASMLKSVRGVPEGGPEAGGGTEAGSVDSSFRDGGLE
jgi:hypothetical protein